MLEGVNKFVRKRCQCVTNGDCINMVQQKKYQSGQ